MRCKCYKQTLSEDTTEGRVASRVFVHELALSRRRKDAFHDPVLERENSGAARHGGFPLMFLLGGR